MDNQDGEAICKLVFLLVNGDTEETRRDGLLPYKLACPPLTQHVVGSRPGWVVPNTKIKLVKTSPCLAHRRWDSDA